MPACALFTPFQFSPAPALQQMPIRVVVHKPIPLLGLGSSNETQGVATCSPCPQAMRRHRTISYGNYSVMLLHWCGGLFFLKAAKSAAPMPQHNKTSVSH